MQNILIYLAFILLLTCTAGTLQAQDSTALKTWTDRIINGVYAEANLTPEDKEWVKTMLETICGCNAIEDEKKGRECAMAFIEKEGLPLEEADFETMTPEQARKFSLLSPLLSMIGGCPE